MQVYGTGFVNRTGLLLCRFGETGVVEASFGSSSVVRCSTPAQAEPGAVSVAVSVDGGVTFGGEGSSGLASVLHFRYLAPSLVTGVSPRSGPATGGTVVSVVGTGFNSDFHFTCKFQPNGPVAESETAAETVGVEALAAYVSPSELACIAPPVVSDSDVGRAMDVHVFVDFGSEAVARLPTSGSGSFTSVPSLKLSGLNPDRGSVAGGTLVDIFGANFAALPAASGGLATTAATETVWCRFGSIVTIGSRFSDGWVQCLSPPWRVRLPVEVEVSVSVNSGADFERGPPGSPLVR